MLKNQKGFTLIELLVVIAIIGILAGILFLAISPKEQSENAKSVIRKNNIKVVKKTLDMYQLDSTINLNPVKDVKS
jgi:type IV pilus assembly protein PilA